MRNKFTVLLVILLLCSFKIKAQGIYTDIDVQEWPLGTVVLSTGESVQGAIKYYYKEDVINVKKEDGTISSFSPVNVNHFITTNTYTGSRQVFKTFGWNLGREQSGFKKPTFFELLSAGNLTLIMREVYVPKYMNGVVAPGQYGNLVQQQTSRHAYSAVGIRPYFYVLLPDGEIKALKRVRKDLLRLFGNKADKVRKYAKKNNLSYDQPHELSAIVKYYNSL